MKSRTPADNSDTYDEIVRTTEPPEPQVGPRPKISLIIPAYNEGNYITPTLESVARAQVKFEAATGDHVEVIVVDNASTDSTADIARRFGCTVVPFQKHQIAAVRNAGAKVARGEYIAFVDADRSILPDSVFLEIASNLDNPRIYGGGSRFRPEKWGVRVFLMVATVAVAARLLGVACVLFYLRRADFDALGGWNEALYAAEDVDLALRMKRAARASGRHLRALRGKVSVCTRKIHLVSPWTMLRVSARAAIRRDFGNPQAFSPIFYDVDKLR